MTRGTTGKKAAWDGRGRKVQDNEMKRGTDSTVRTSTMKGKKIDSDSWSGVGVKSCGHFHLILLITITYSDIFLFD